MVASLLFDDYVILFWFCGDAVGACQFAKITAAFVCALLSSFTIS